LIKSNFQIFVLDYFDQGLSLAGRLRFHLLPKQETALVFHKIKHPYHFRIDHKSVLLKMKVMSRLTRWASFRASFRTPYWRTCRVPSRRAAPLPLQVETHLVLNPSVVALDFSDYCRYSTPSSSDNSVLVKKRVVGQPNVPFLF
jgi:hypothetical protein